MTVENGFVVRVGVSVHERPVKYFQIMPTCCSQPYITSPFMFDGAFIFNQFVHPIFIANWRSMSVYVCIYTVVCKRLDTHGQNFSYCQWLSKYTMASFPKGIKLKMAHLFNIFKKDYFFFAVSK